MVILLLLSIFMPPVAVALAVGINTSLLLNVGLTLTGWIPGIIHALWVITKETKKSECLGNY